MPSNVSNPACYVYIASVYVDEEDKLTTAELFVAKLLFGWSCPLPWQRFARLLNEIVDDAFFDFFLMLCIVFNTILMALDHAGISEEMAFVLAVGNYVSSFSTKIPMPIN